jgi:hypothetical protein
MKNILMTGSTIMKAYLFNTDNGLYEGETFEEAGMLQYVEGITTIAPPRYEAGQVPVFDAEHDGWQVLPVSVVCAQLRAMRG